MPAVAGQGVVPVPDATIIVEHAEEERRLVRIIAEGFVVVASDVLDIVHEQPQFQCACLPVFHGALEEAGNGGGWPHQQSLFVAVILIGCHS